jgi:methylated-DNA-protein-cysteine methyltransferase-like protein
MDKAAVDRVLALVAQIPSGKVVTYKQVAKAASLKNPRQVGKILSLVPGQVEYPCHRVVRSDGRVAEGTAFGERYGQIVLLRREGVVFLGGKVRLADYHWEWAE